LAKFPVNLDGKSAPARQTYAERVVKNPKQIAQKMCQYISKKVLQYQVQN
jgi:hypothetical protein